MESQIKTLENKLKLDKKYTSALEECCGSAGFPVAAVKIAAINFKIGGEINSDSDEDDVAALASNVKDHLSVTEWCVVSEMNSFTYGGLTCPANHTFCLEVKEDFSMGQINILGKVPLDVDVSPWWDDTFYEQSTQALVNMMDLVQGILLQTEYHLNKAQVEANLAKRTTEILSSSSTRSAWYAYTWWDWMFRGCAIASVLIFSFTLIQCCYFRCLLRAMRTSTNMAIALSPLRVPALQKLKLSNLKRGSARKSTGQHLARPPLFPPMLSS
ncbi:hypothetical protein DPX16_19532 [Anabarilius grahami]|uniref:Uncharacterized protein n=1 Tax=Anabarilius grahami TaxID=495550 RepID=A0A3N0Y7A9_ANAGA|nr:hypothetical protein DPX16_19532 [Anabarilius grahami]